MSNYHGKKVAIPRDLKRRQWNVDEDIRNEETEQVNLEEDNDSPKEDACTLQEVDLVANCPLLRVTPSRTPSPAPSYLSSSYKSMGQRPSTLLRPKISLTWVLRGQQHQHNEVNNTASIQDSQIIRKSKDRSSRRSVKSIKSIKTKESTEIIDRDKHERCNVLQEIDKIVRHEKVLNIMKIKYELTTPARIDSSRVLVTVVLAVPFRASSINDGASGFSWSLEESSSEEESSSDDQENPDAPSFMENALNGTANTTMTNTLL
ncbi:hypothetical protein KQX54_017549 [Cotesia glomerata]|uniref:Uncharacterized protein n=1 Tax=Cotesia glomerata TaxID=32391 RepID=A0AAV7IXW8_COTGL|nr:hypothetical protein KQX54_017549 [Cotesia glomerata]